MFRFVLVSFCLISAISYIFQKNRGFDTDFSTLNNFAAIDYHDEGYGAIDPKYTQTKGKQATPAFSSKKRSASVSVTKQEITLALFPVKKPPFIIALPVVRPDPNSIQIATQKPRKRMTLSSIRNAENPNYAPNNFNVPALTPEHLSRGKLLKQHRMEIAGNTDALYRDYYLDKNEQYSRDSQVKVKNLFKKGLKRHPHGYRRRRLNAYSFVVRKHRRRTPKRNFIKKSSKSLNGSRRLRTETRVTSTSARYKRR